MSPVALAELRMRKQSFPLVREAELLVLLLEAPEFNMDAKQG